MVSLSYHSIFDCSLLEFLAHDRFHRIAALGHGTAHCHTDKVFRIVAAEEAADMDDRVIKYEPYNALFVPDNDPLVFYRSIISYAVAALRPGGGLYFEINPRFGPGIEAMLRDRGFADIDMQRDYLGRYRFITAGSPRP